MKKIIQKGKGFTLVETLVAVSVFVLIVVALGAFQRNVFTINSFLQTNLTNQNEARKILRPFVGEVRSASLSNTGAYPIATAATSTFTFYTDTDSDGVKERIRYFLEGSDFKKGTLVPSGSPLEYDEDDEEFIEVIHNVVATSTIFSYYDENYDGTASSTPLEQPVSINEIRLVKIIISIDDDPDKPPSPFTVTTQVSIRNLKNNL